MRRLAAAGGNWDGKLAIEIAAGDGVGIGFDFGDGSCGEQLAAELARAGAEVEQIISGADDVGVVLDDENRIAEVAQLFEDANQLGGVAGMEADGWLVENIERADEARAERGCELNALRFAAGERGGEAVEGEVVEADGVEEMQALPDLGEDAAGDLMLRWREFEFAEELVGGADGHCRGFADVLAAHSHGSSLGAEALAFAVGAGSVAAIFAEHDADVELVFLALHAARRNRERRETRRCR